MSRRTTTTRVPRVAGMLAACALAASLASCDRSDPVQDEINRVSVGIGAISTSGSTALPSVENRRAMYQWAIGRLTGKGGGSMNIAGVKTDVATPTNPAAVDSKIAGQAFAANLLVARGYAGLGEISAQEAARLEAGASLQISPISAALDQWLSQNAIADAFASYNPAAESAQIEKQIGDKQKLADDARANKDRQQATIAGLEKQAADLMANSQALRQQAAEIRGRGTSVSETARLELITEAVRIGRQADEIEKQAANLLARVDIEKPQAETLQRGIDELTTQIQLLRTDKDNLRQRADQNAAAAKRARDEAAAAAARLTQMLATLTAAREALSAPTDAAASAYGNAVTAARKAGMASRDSKAQAAVTQGNYQHALADVLATKARGLSSYARLLTELSAAKPPLPGAADLSSKAAAATQAASTAMEAAKAAFQSALDHYSSAGGSGDTQDRLTSLKASMSAILGKLPESGETPTPAAQDAPDGAAPAPAPEAPPAAGGLAAVETEVRAAIDQILAAAKGSDYAAVRAMMHADGEANTTALDSMMTPLSLDHACRAAYSKSLAQTIADSNVQSVKSNPMIATVTQMVGQLNLSPEQAAALNAADATIAPVSETEAAVNFPAVEGLAGSMLLKKVDGAWKVDLTPMIGPLMANPMLSGAVKPIGEAFTKVTGKLTGGEYADADAMLIDLNMEFMAAMKKSGAGGNGGGAGGPGGAGGG